MSSLTTAGRRRALELAFAITLGIGLLGIVSVSRADEHWDRDHRYREHEFREHEFHQHEFLDSRYHHDHYYPPVGFVFGVLPPGYVAVRHHGVDFYFAGGVWYSAAGRRRFVVVAPPLGLVVRVLPPYYTTVFVGGAPYYYANSAYYVQSPQGYVIVNPPPGNVVAGPPLGTAVSPAPPNAVVELPPSNPGVQRPPSGDVAQGPGAQMFLYPRQGQSQQQQAKDQYECDRWAIGQTGYDPSLPNAGGAPPNQMDGYRRAIGACLDARGYTVR
jgi:hypothetical protein